MSLFAFEIFVTTIAFLLSVLCFAITASHRAARDYEISLSLSFFAILTSLGYLGIFQSGAVETALVFATKLKFIGLVMQLVVFFMVFSYFKVKLPRILFFVYFAIGIFVLLMVINFNVHMRPIPGNPISWFSFMGRWFFKGYYIQIIRELIYLRAQSNGGYVLFMVMIVFYMTSLIALYFYVMRHNHVIKRQDLTLLFSSIIIPVICFLVEETLPLFTGREILPVVPMGIIVSDLTTIYLVAFRRFYNVNAMANDVFFDLMETPAFVTTETFRITNINKATLDTFAFINEDMVGQRAMSVLPDYIVRPFENLISLANEESDGRDVTAEEYSESDDNLVFVGDKTYQPRLRMVKTHGNLLGYILSLVDVTLLHNYKSRLEYDVQMKTQQIQKMRDQMVFSFSFLAEHHDLSSKGHLTRTSFYSKAIACELYKENVYMDEIDESFIETIEHVSPLHDIGKIYIDERLLNRAGPLTKGERLLMESHTVRGAEFLYTALRDCGDKLYSSMAHDITLHHHEWWNGTGYPSKLEGESIPLCARIMAVSDVFDALTSERPYKRAFTVAEAYDIIHYQAGTHFDPAVVKAFEEIRPEVEMIHDKLSVPGMSE